MPLSRLTHEIQQDFVGSEHLDAIGIVQILGTISIDNLGVTAGVEEYPRLGDRVYSAPHTFLAKLPALVDTRGESKPILLDLGTIASGSNSLLLQSAPCSRRSTKCILTQKCFRSTGSKDKFAAGYRFAGTRQRGRLDNHVRIGTSDNDNVLHYLFEKAVCSFHYTLLRLL